MAKDLWESSQGVRDLFKAASDASGVDMEKLLFQSSAEDLQATDKAQIALTLANLSAHHALGEAGIQPDACAGFSLGEYSALCAAGVVRLQDVFPMVKTRGLLMEKAARALDSGAGSPGMAAVLGLPAERVAAVVEPLAPKGAFLANYNSPGQMVISGTADGLAAAEKALKDAGAKRIVRLKVSGPFHCSLMAQARKEMEEALSVYPFSDPRIPVWSNVTGRRIGTGEEAKRLCGEQMVSLVRWVSIEEELCAEGFERWLEVGPGAVLAGLMKALKPDVPCLPAGTAAAIVALRQGGAA